MSDSEILVRSTYYLGIRTGVKPDAQSYQEQAEGLVEHLQCILEDLPTVQALTRMSPFEVFHTSVEIKMEQGELCAAAVVDIDAPGKVQLDKTKFSRLVRDKYRSRAVKIETRAVEGVQG